MNLIQEKNNVYKSYRNNKNNNNMQYLRRLKLRQEDLHNEIEISKSNYYSRITYKLTHIQKNTKVYWALLKRFLSSKKIPLIPPYFHGNEYVTDFKKKAELFNPFFEEQSSFISNSSEPPLNLHFTTEKRLDTLNFSNNDIEMLYKTWTQTDLTISSSIYKVIRPVLNFSFFFTIKFRKHQKALKSTKSTKRH